MNSAIDFDGSDDHVAIVNDTLIDLNDALSQELAISYWVYPHSDGESNTGYIFQENTNTYCQTTNDDATYVDLACALDLSTDATLTVTDALRLSQWSHVTLLWNNDADDELTIYINGTYRGESTNGVGDPSTDTANLYLGGNTTNFDGLLDDFRIYNYALTPTQVKAVMNYDSALKFE